MVDSVLEVQNIKLPDSGGTTGADVFTSTGNVPTIASGVTFPAGHIIKILPKVTNSTYYQFYNANPGNWPSNRLVETASGTPAVIQVNTADLLYPGSSKLEITFNMVIAAGDYSFTSSRREQINIGVNSSTIIYSSIPEYWVQSGNFYSPYITHRGVIDITSPSTDTSYYYYLHSLNPVAGNNVGTLLHQGHFYSEYSIKEISQ
jgi:hypothetical protein